VPAAAYTAEMLRCSTYNIISQKVLIGIGGYLLSAFDFSG
jgi:hypothetical protein